MKYSLKRGGTATDVLISLLQVVSKVAILQKLSEEVVGWDFRIEQKE
jgi:hypothetical protein